MDDAPQETPPTRPDAAPPSTSGELADVLGLAAPRQRTVDDHMFRAGRTSFRLQLFTAPEQRAVAVATQEEDEAPSLTNVAESCAAAVWRQHCPEQELPPVWIERQLPGAFDDEPDFRLVTFGETAPYQVHLPGWHKISAEQLVRLVGGPVAEDRGEGYVPSELAPEPELRFKAIGLWRMARPRPFREECVRRVRAGAEPPAGPLARSVPDDGDDEPLRGPSALTHRSGTAAALIRPVREWGCRSRRRGRVCGCSGG
ncbi:hypothetical protein CTU88_27210 [Streptomyces sp. JV178]|nr:hypothetical protein [Streptomyces sp. JV178]PIM69664.1 hypothetical protein CTU88_27210 [Streptomyces sp. JV178]